MKKFIYLTASWLLLISSLCAQSTKELNISTQPRVNSLRSASELTGFGYADRSVGQVQGLGMADAVMSAAIKLPAMAGNKIKGVNFLVNLQQDGSASTSDKGRIFISRVSDNKVLVLQEVTIAKGVNKHSFGTPFEMKDNEEYYVGYQVRVSAKGSPLAFDRSIHTIPEANFIDWGTSFYTTNGTSKLFDFREKSYYFGSLLVFADIEDSKGFLSNALYFCSGKSKKSQLSAGQNEEFEIQVRNLGTAEVSNWNLKSRFGAFGQEESSSVNQKVGPNETKTFTVTLKAPQKPGLGTLHCTIDKANGKNNLFTSTSGQVAYKVEGNTGAIARKGVLLERFTGEYCSNCPTADAPIATLVAQMQENNSEVNFIAHHAGYSPDKFTLKESENIVNDFFTKRGTYAPALSIDRRPFGKEQDGLCLVVNPNSADLYSFYQKAVAEKQDVIFEKITQKVENNMISLQIDGKVVGGADFEDLFITAVVTEYDVPAINQANAPSGYKHEAVARRFLTPGYGTKVTPKEDGTFSLSIGQVSIHRDWKPENMRVVVFAHNNLKNRDVAMRYVHNSTTLWFGKDLSTMDILPENVPVVYVQDGYITVNGQAQKMEVYNLVGQLVTTTPTTQLSAGYYIVKVINAHGVFTSKVIIR